MSALLPFLRRVMEGEHLSPEDARDAMAALLSGETPDAQIAGFLVALRMKGETSNEVAGFARALRERTTRVHVDLGREVLVDTCGTGGDGASTFNISTVAAFVVAGAGVHVAKHGNRSISGQCGSADVLEALGVNIDQTPERIGAAIRDVGIGFLFAPALHGTMKSVQPTRRDLKIRTVFNLLGPLANPALASRQLIGTPSAAAGRVMAHALATLQCDRAFLVHGEDGLDEVSTTGPTLVFEVRGERVAEHIWYPEQFGVKRVALHDLRGGAVDENCLIARRVLDGRSGPHRDIVIVNAAAVLLLGEKAADPISAARLAAEAIDSGRARDKLVQLASFTNSAHSASR